MQAEAISGYRWIALSVSFFAFFAFAFTLQLVPPLMHPIVHEFKISCAEAGLLMSAVVVPGIFLTIPAGMLTDRYGAKLVGSVSMSLIILGSLLTAIATSFMLALIGRTILGIGGAFITTAMPAVIPQWFPPKELGKAMGVFGITMPVATIAALLSASALMLIYGWRYPFYVSTTLAVLSMIFLILLAKEGPLKLKHEEGQSIHQAFKSIETWKVGIVWLLFNAAVLSFITWSLMLFWEFKAMNPTYASFLSSIPMWAAILCVPFFG